MGDRAEVTLSAIDDISGPASNILKSLQALEDQTQDLNYILSGGTSGATRMAAGITDLGNASEKSVNSHRAAHQALSLVSGSMVELAGGSIAAQSGVRVLDSVMFQMAATGGAISVSFIAIVAAAAAAGYAFKTMAEAGKKNDEEMKSMTDSAVKSVSQLNYLDEAQRRVAAVGAAQMGRQVTSLKDQISELTQKMKENSEQALKMSQPQVEHLGGMEGSVTLPAASDGGAAALAQQKMNEQLIILRNQLKVTEADYKNLTTASSKYKSVVGDQAPLQAEISSLERTASGIENVGRAVGHLEVDYEALKNVAQEAGISVAEAAEIMVAQNNVVKTGVENLAMAFGTTLGNAIMGAKDAWKEGLKVMIGAVFDAVTQVLLAAAIMNQGLTAALIPGTFVGILAMVAVVQGMKAVAMSALSSAGNKAASQGAASMGSSATASAGAGGTSTGASGPGGSAVSSAQKEVVNNISVSLPVHALDLSSVSDIQMKSLATRIGRIIADSAGQGQFSLVGA